MRIANKIRVVLLFLTIAACQKEKGKTKPEYKPLIEAVYASGKVKAFNEYKVFSTVSGILQAHKVTEGDTVYAGQLIAVIQSQASDLRFENAKILLDAARRNAGKNSPILLELQSVINTAKAKLREDSVNMVRYNSMYAKNAGTAYQAEKATLDFTTSKNNYNAALKRYATTVEQLGTELKNAEKQTQLNYSAKNDFNIRSLINGKVFALYKKPGEIISPQEPLALIGDHKKFMVQLIIDELDINKVNIGQKVLLTLDTYGEEVYEAKVSKIYPLLDPQTQTFTVESIFEKAPSILYPGMTTEANIIIRQKNQALVIPKSYLIGKDTVLVNKTEKKKIMTGIGNLEFVEVLQGLDSNTFIYKP